MIEYNKDDKLILEELPLEVFRLIQALIDSTTDNNNEKKPMSKT